MYINAHTTNIGLYVRNMDILIYMKHLIKSNTEIISRQILLFYYFGIKQNFMILFDKLKRENSESLLQLTTRSEDVLVVIFSTILSE